MPAPAGPEGEQLPVISEEVQSNYHPFYPYVPGGHYKLLVLAPFLARAMDLLAVDGIEIINDEHI